MVALQRGGLVCVCGCTLADFSTDASTNHHPGGHASTNYDENHDECTDAGTDASTDASTKHHPGTHARTNHDENHDPVTDASTNYDDGGGNRVCELRHLCGSQEQRLPTNSLRHRLRAVRLQRPVLVAVQRRRLVHLRRLFGSDPCADAAAHAGALAHARTDARTDASTDTCTQPGAEPYTGTCGPMLGDRSVLRLPARGRHLVLVYAGSVQLDVSKHMQLSLQGV